MVAKTFNDYEKIIAETAIYPDAGKGTPITLAYTSLGLASEAGEVAGKIKKWIRGDGELDKRLTGKELGGCLWYIAAAARELGYSLQDIAEMNMVQLLDRKERGVLQGNGDER